METPPERSRILEVLCDELRSYSCVLEYYVTQHVQFFLKALMSEVGGSPELQEQLRLKLHPPPPSRRTERDVSAWSSDRLRQLLLSIRVEGPEGVCQMTEVSKLEGEASINNRKGKLFFFYEWQLKASWLGQ